MKCAILQFKLKPEKMSEFEKPWTEIYEKAKNEPGFINGLALYKGESGHCLSIGFWESEQHARDFGRSKLYQEFLNTLKEYSVGEPERELYDVSDNTRDVISGVQKKKAA